MNIHINRQFLQIISLLVCLSFYTGCGYRILGEHSQDSYPYSMAIMPILNRTANPRIDWIVTHTIIKELTSWPGIKITPQEDADYIMSGEILSYKSQIPYTYDIEQNPIEYKLEILMSFSLKKRQSYSGEAKVLEADSQVHISRIQEEEIYHISASDLDLSKLAEWQAMERAIKRMIKRAMDQLIGSK